MAFPADEGSWGHAVLRGVAGVWGGQAVRVGGAFRPPSLRGALATKQSIPSLRGEMDCFASLAMTDDTPSRSRGSIRPRFAIEFPLPSECEGAGNAGCALHPRSR